MPDALAVRYMHSAMRGAPVINGQNGTLIAPLNALLSDGWGAAAPSSLTVSGGVATAVFGATISWEVGAVIEVTGGTPSSINTLSRVISSVSNGSNITMTFATTAPDGTYTGSSVKYAGAGWEKVFTATNKVVYRSTDVASPRHYLRVRDTYGTYATVTGFESMTGIDTGTGRFSRAASLDNNQSAWDKSLNADATPVNYLLAADSRAVLHAIAIGIPASPQYASAVAWGFGDAIPLAPTGDVWCTFMSSCAAGSGGAIDGALSSGSLGSGSGGTSMPRAVNGTGGPRPASTRPLTGGMSTVSGSDTTLGPVLSSVDGALFLSQMLFLQEDYSPRAVVPGVWYVPQNQAAGLLLDKGMYMGAGDLAGRRLCAVPTAASTYSTVDGVFFLDVTGPWR